MERITFHCVLSRIFSQIYQEISFGKNEKKNEKKNDDEKKGAGSEDVWVRPQATTVGHDCCLCPLKS